ncbi:hypothetical protein [Streptomyces sp. NPDC049813]|uniref:hypothetical protein n=1 Tax=Streptomyces sp. NPDC049813 TaxID=3365597 RepID=UPI00378AF583
MPEYPPGWRKWSHGSLPGLRSYFWFNAEHLTSPGMGKTAYIAALLRELSDNAYESGPPTPAADWARCAYTAARSARDAALRGDHAEVDVFSRVWLGVKDAEAWRDGVVDALLSEGWDRGPLQPDHTFAKWLKLRAQRLLALWKPLWERMQGRQYVRLLSEPLVPGREDLGTLADALRSTSPSAEDIVLGREPEDPRLGWVLDRLAKDPMDVRVAHAFAENPGLTWSQAARLAGARDPQDAERRGERVRRKLKRLAAQYVALHPVATP